MENEHSAIISKADDLPREMKRTKDKDFDRIYKYYYKADTRIELSKEEEEIRKRWEQAWFILCKGRSTKICAEILERTFKISKATAYNDLKRAQMLFGDPRNDLKEAKRRIVEQQLQEGANRAYKLGDLDMYYKFLKEIGEINGLKNETTDQNLADIMKKLVPTTINIITNVDELKKAAEKLREEIIVDIPYEEEGKAD
ncbi:MAG: hypothetical protein ACK5QX_03755 [bacterium]